MRIKVYAIISPTALKERKLYSHNDVQTGIQIKLSIILLRRTQHYLKRWQNPSAQAYLMKSWS